MFSKSSKKQKKHIRSWEGQIEALRDLPTGMAQAAKDDLTLAAKDTWRQVFGFEKTGQKLSGELKVGQSIDLTPKARVAQTDLNTPQYGQQWEEDTGEDLQREYIAPGYEYHRQFASFKESVVAKEDTRQIQIRIEQIVMELRRLTASSSELAVEFSDVTMEATPQQPGQYHLNFFEWVMGVIQKARERIEESQTWLSMFKSKRKQKGYWQMFKKHGTTFGLSGERVVSTQTG